MKFIFLFIVASTSIFAANLAGKVISSQGSVTALDANQKERTLKRGSNVYETDTITVGNEGKVQLKFLDGGLVILTSDTNYRINSYVFTKKKSEFSSELFKGGMKAMTGTIGKENPDNYNVKTPVATIGVRGTILEILYQFGNLDVGSVTGTIKVSNNAGTVVLTAGRYVSTSSNVRLGTPTNVQPTAIAAASFAPPPGGLSLERAQEIIIKTPVEPPSQPIQSEGLNKEIQEGDLLNIPSYEGNPPCG